MKARVAQLCPAGVPRTARLAFTLVELLVVVSIIAILIASGVPAIRNMIYTSTGSLAESQIRFGLAAARDLAIRNASGDAAAVFTYDPAQGRISIIPMVYVGQLLDTVDPSVTFGSAANNTAYRDVFAPSVLAEPTQLPAGWMVRGFAPPGAIFNGQLAIPPVPSNGWYFDKNNHIGSPAGNRTINLGNDTISGTANKGNWVFPETDFYDPTVTENLQPTPPNSRCTFMVRFQSGTGRIVGASSVPAVVLLPRATIDNSSNTQYNPLANPNSVPNNLNPAIPADNGPDWRRVDRSDNLPAWARDVLKLTRPSDVAALLGCRSTDCALAGSVSLLALCDESRLAAAIGARGVNKLTGSLYGVDPNAPLTVGTLADIPKAPNIDLSLWSSGSQANTNPEFVQMMINNYMISALKYSDVSPGAPMTNIQSEARLFQIDTFAGSLSEVN